MHIKYYELLDEVTWNFVLITVALNEGIGEVQNSVAEQSH